MTTDIALVLAILGAALVLFVSEIVRMELVALLVLSALALTGLVTPAEALSGFSNPAVITVWAMFILSAGLTRAGVADWIGAQIVRRAKLGEIGMVVTIMLVTAVLSAFMNNIGVAALMLPVAMNIARRGGMPPSRLLMPLAYGSLLGGLTTLIGTPPNLLVSEAMRERGLPPFSMFDFAPVGGAVMTVGILFVAFVGRHLLPQRDPGREASAGGAFDLPKQYRLDERSAVVRLVEDSLLSGRTLQQSRFGSATGLVVYAILRNGRTMLAPGADDVLQAKDRLLVEGKLDRFNELRRWQQLVVEDDVPDLQDLVSGEFGLTELEIAPDGSLVGQTLAQLGFRGRFGGIVLALDRGAEVTHVNLAQRPLRGGDRLLVQGRRAELEKLRETAEFQDSSPTSDAEIVERYGLSERIFVLRVPADSALEGSSLGDSRLGDALGLAVLGIRRESRTQMLPGADEPLMAGDALIVRGSRDDLTVFRGLQALEIESEAAPELRDVAADGAGLLEAMLSPRTSLAGKTPAQLNFRERFGVQILAILRQGRVRRSNLRDTPLRFGDALLFLGPQQKLRVVAQDPEFLVLSQAEEDAEPVSRKRAPLAVLIMAAVIVPVVAGWLPIAIASVSGAALMVLVGCLSMDGALRSIDWRAVFLIAGMLPLGIALQTTGAALYVAEALLAALGDAGPFEILAVLYLLTAVLTCIVPTAALVVLMAPIALKASSTVGLAPQAAMMAVAMAASASFTSPISHPANLLVMGPGGYRFVDYLKLGIPLTLVVMAVVLVVLPLFWPLAG